MNSQSQISKEQKLVYIEMLKTHMQRLDKSTSDIAAALRVSESAVRKWTQGSIPSGDNAVKVRLYLNSFVEVFKNHEVQKTGIINKILSWIKK